MKNQLNEDIELYKELVEEFKALDSGDFQTAYTLSQKALIMADRWNEIMLNSVKYAKDMDCSKTDFSNYCYQKFKMLIKVHDFARVVYRQGVQGLQNSFYGEDLM